NTNVSGNGTSPSPSAEQPAQQPNKSVELTISAAASLTDALHEIQRKYETKHPSVKLFFNFGASGALQQQIEQGAPADLSLSAAPKNMKALDEKQLIAEDDQSTLLYNELVVLKAKEAKMSLQTLSDLASSDVKNIAIGIPESVPAG